MKNYRFVAIEASLLVCAIIITAIYCLFGINGVYFDVCVIHSNVTTNETVYGNFCLDYEGGSYLQYLIGERRIWPMLHFIIPCLFYLFFSSSEFAHSYNMQSKQSDKDPVTWNRFSLRPFVYSAGLTLALMCIVEIFEGICALFEIGYFREEPKDWISDLIMACYGIILMSFTIWFPLIKPNSFLFITRSFLENILTLMIFVVLCIATLLSLFQFVTNDDHVLYVGRTTCFPVMLLILGFHLLMDFGHIKKHADVLEIKNILTRSELLRFWITILLFILCMWIPTLEAVLPTYTSVVVGSSFFIISLFSLKIFWPIHAKIVIDE